MEKLERKSTAKTPNVSLDALDGLLIFEGRSNPENARDFFHPIIEWMEEYIKHPAELTELRVNLEHFNTSSSKYLMDVLRKIRYLADNDHNFKVTWLYEEDDMEMLDTAEAYEVMTGLTFDKVSYPEPLR